MFAKRSKGSDSASPGGLLKKPAFTLTKASGAATTTFDASKLKPSLPSVTSLSSSARNVLKPRAPSTKVSSFKAAKSSVRMSPLSASSPSLSSISSSLSASSGRSSLRAPRRGGILSNKRRSAASSKSSLPFSLDAALKGTFSPFESRMAAAALPSPLTASVDESGMSSNWFFDIHEDTPEQEMTNLLQHSTCVLDISSDEESEQKLRRERAEGRDKENIPPPNDVSQTSIARTEAAQSEDDMAIEKARNPLSQLNAADFYAAGCDEASVILVHADEAEEELLAADKSIDEIVNQKTVEVAETKAVEVKATEVPEVALSVDCIMTGDKPACEAALLEPMEGTGESFELWESGSQKADEL